MKTRMSWAVFVAVIALTGGCSMEISGGEPPGSTSVSQTSLVVSSDSFFQNWTRGFWVRSLPVFPGSLVVVVQDSAGTRAVLHNGRDFPIEFGGEFGYACTPDAPIGLGTGTNLINIPGRFDLPGQGLIVQGNADAFVSFRPCDPEPGAGKSVTWSGGSVAYRPAIPDGAVPFHDAFAQRGDGHSFFPGDQMRLSAGTPVARSGPLYVGDATSHTLHIRYANAHPDRPDAVVKVGIQNLDAGGATVKAFNQVAFPVTPSSTDFDQWQIVTVNLTTSPSLQNVYVRLEMKSADIVYLDATWLSL